MLKVRCKNCNAVLESHPTQTRCCGCDNFTTLRGENISGLDLTRIELISNLRNESNPTTISLDDYIFYAKRDGSTFDMEEVERFLHRLEDHLNKF